MNKIIAALFICLIASQALANDFTIDVRSTYHVGVSTVIGAGINSSLIATDVPLFSRVLTSAFGCLAVGAMKEYGMDSKADFGDLFFDAVGCGLGIAVTEGVAVYIGKNQVGLTGTF